MFPDDRLPVTGVEGRVYRGFMDAQWVAVLVLLAVFLVLHDLVYRSPRLLWGPHRQTAHSWRARRRRPPPVLLQREVRPFEVVVADARRLAARLEHPRGLSYTKQEALRGVYDRVLGEMCDALGVDHLLAVLPEGDELDTERGRVESMLWLAGVHLDEAA